jgi:glycosyltransferase involved in cell wall biosynthesis
METEQRNSLAIIGGFVRPRSSAPHGTLHASYLMCRALARLGDYAELHVFQEESRLLAADGELTLPNEVPTRLFHKPFLTVTAHRYRAIYVANGEQISSSPHVLRPSRDWAPVICSVGTAHSPGQWSNLLVGLASRAIRATDGFIFKSTASLDLFRSVWTDWGQCLRDAPAFPDQVAVIPNGVDVQANRRTESLRADTRRRLHLADGDVVFLAYSRLSPGTKGDLLALVTRWQEVNGAFPEAVLLLSGAAVDRGFLSELRATARAVGVGNRVLVVDNPFELMPDPRSALMSAADVFLHVSTGVEETSSLVVHEAMAHSLPVIVSDWAGMAAVVRDGENGFVVETRCAPADAPVSDALFGTAHVSLATAAAKLVSCDWEQLVRRAIELRSPELRQRLGAASRRDAEGRSIDKIARCYGDFVTQVSAHAQARWSGESSFRPLVPLDRVLTAQASRPLHAYERVRLRDVRPARILLAGSNPEDARRIEIVAGALSQGKSVTIGELALALSAGTSASGDRSRDPQAALAGVGRLIVRLLNRGLIELVA